MLNKLKTLEGVGKKKLNCHPEFSLGSDQVSTIDNNSRKKSHISMSVGRIPNQVRNDKKSFAFTLAEVLITLVIIGVIAAVTVPAIIQQTQKQEYVAGLKKAYSTLSNALYRVSDNNGYPRGDYLFLKTADFSNEFVKVVNVVKKCNSTAECFPTKINASNTQYKRLDGQLTQAVDGKTVITSDGQMYSFALTSTAGTNGLSEENANKAIIRVLVDVNGWKKPNQWGYDLFAFYILDGMGVVPAGLNSTANCNKNAGGGDCAAKVLKENKISY